MQLDGLCVSTSSSEYSIKEARQQLKPLAAGVKLQLQKALIPAKTFQHKLQGALDDPIATFIQARGGELSLVAQHEACDWQSPSFVQTEL